MNTKDSAYADYLIQNQGTLRSLVFQLPYRKHLKSKKLGRTLDVGCGAGRNLRALHVGSLGIDHNEWVVKACVEQGFEALTTAAFMQKRTIFENSFDSILLSHVAEHMTILALTQLLRDYQAFLKPGGNIMMICPQEAGYASDGTHIQFMDFETMEACLRATGYQLKKSYSFPFPRFTGKFFKHNEFIVLGTK